MEKNSNSLICKTKGKKYYYITFAKSKWHDLDEHYEIDACFVIRLSIDDKLDGKKETKKLFGDDYRYCYTEEQFDQIYDSEDQLKSDFSYGIVDLEIKN